MRNRFSADFQYWIGMVYFQSCFKKMSKKYKTILK